MIVNPKTDSLTTLTALIGTVNTCLYKLYKTNLST